MRRAGVAATGLALTVGLCLLGRHVGAAERLDADVLGSIREATLSWTDLADGISHLGDSRSATALSAGGLFAGLALLGPRRLPAPIILLVGANVSTQLPQLVFHGVRYVDTEHVRLVTDVPAPSGHATFTASFALAATLAAPPRVRRWVAAVGAAYAVPVASSTLVLGTHFPSDVLAGWSMAFAWLAVTGGRVGNTARSPSRARLTLVGGLVLGGALLGGLVVGHDNASLGSAKGVAGFAALAGGSAAVAGSAVAAGQRRSSPSGT